MHTLNNVAPCNLAYSALIINKFVEDVNVCAEVFIVPDSTPELIFRIIGTIFPQNVPLPGKVFY